MKAVLVREGGALSYEDFPDPVAGPGEVVVEIHAAAVNRRELLVRNPPGPAYQFNLPLVPGAGSGVSTFAVMLAVQAGATVLVTSSTEEKLSRAREIGASDGVLYTEDGWPDAVRGLTGGRGVDVVLDSVGSTWADSLRCLRKGGRLVVFGGTGGPMVELDVRFVYLNWLSIRGFLLGSPREFKDYLLMVEEGGWKPVIDRAYPLAEAEAAHEYLKSGEGFGKLVLNVR